VTIDDVVVRMGWAAAPDLAVTPLGGGITNLNYRVDVRGEAYAVRIPGADSIHLGIDRAREHACTAAAHESRVAPGVVAFLEPAGVLVTRFVLGRTPSEEAMRRPDMLRRVARTLRRYHTGRAFPGIFSPFRTIRDYLAVASANGAPLPERLDWMLERAARLEEVVESTEDQRPCHNDLLPGNFLDDGERLWILDWEYAAMGDPFFDLGNFAAHHQLTDSLEHILLDAYAGAVTVRGVSRLKLMKIISDLREAMWGMVQVAISAIEFDFSAYGRRHFDRCAAQLDDPRLPAWLAGAAGSASQGAS
jgi:thiamine kinase-like enzyme